MSDTSVKPIASPIQSDTASKQKSSGWISSLFTAAASNNTQNHENQRNGSDGGWDSILNQFESIVDHEVNSDDRSTQPTSTITPSNGNIYTDTWNDITNDSLVMNSPNNNITVPSVDINTLIDTMPDTNDDQLYGNNHQHTANVVHSDIPVIADHSDSELSDSVELSDIDDSLTSASDIIYKSTQSSDSTYITTLTYIESKLLSIRERANKHKRTCKYNMRSMKQYMDNMDIQLNAVHTNESRLQSLICTQQTQYTMELDKRDNEIISLKQEVDRLHSNTNESQQLRDELDNANNKSHELQIQLDQSNNNNTLLTQQLNGIQQQYDQQRVEHERAVNELRQQLDNVQPSDNNVPVSDSFDPHVMDQYTELQQHYGELQHSRASIQQQLDELTQSHYTLQQQYNELQQSKHNDSLDQSIRAEYDELYHQYNQLQHEYNKSDEAIQELHGTIHRLQTQLDNANNQIESLQLQSQQSTAVADDSSSNNNSEQVGYMQQTINELTSINDQYKHANEQVTQQYNELVEQYTQLQQSSTVATQEIHQSDNNINQQQLNDLQYMLDETNRELSAKQSTIAQLQSELQRSYIQMDSMGISKHERTTSNNKQYITEIDSLKQQIEQLQWKLDESNADRDHAIDELKSMEHQLSNIKPQPSSITIDGQLVSDTQQLNQQLLDANNKINVLQQQLLNTSTQLPVDTVPLPLHEQTCMDLQDEIDSTTNELNQCKTRLNQHIAQINSLQDDMQHHIESYTALQERYDELNVQLQQSADTNNQLQSTVSSIESTLIDANIQLQNVTLQSEQQLAELNHTIESLQQHINQYQLQLNELQNDNHQLVQADTEMQQKYDELQNTINQSNISNQQINELQLRNDELVQQLADINTLYQSSRQRSDDLNIQLTALQQELHEHKLQHQTQLNEQQSSYEQQLTNLRDATLTETNQFNEQQAQYESQIESMTQQIHTLQQQIDSSHIQQQNAINELQLSHQSTVTELNQRTSTLQQQLDDKQSEYDTLCQSMTELTQQLQLSAEQISALQLRLDVSHTEQEQRISELQSEIEVQASALHAVHAANKQIEYESNLRQYTEQQLTEIQNEYDSLQQQYDNTQADLNKLHGRYDELQTEHDNLQLYIKRIESDTSRLNEIENELSDNKQFIEKLQYELQQKDQYLDQASTDVTDAYQQISELKSQLAISDADKHDAQAQLNIYVAAEKQYIDKHNILEGKYKTLQQQHEVLQQQLESQSSNTSELDQLKEKLVKWGHKLRDMKYNHTILQDTIDKQNKQLIELNQIRQQYNDLTHDKDQLQLSYDDINTTLIQVQHELTTVRQQYESVVKSQSTLENQYNAMEMRYDELHERYDSQSTQYTELQSDYDHKLSEWNNERQFIIAEKDQLYAENIQLVNEMSSMESMIEQLKLQQHNHRAVNSTDSNDVEVIQQLNQQIQSYAEHITELQDQNELLKQQVSELNRIHITDPNPSATPSSTRAVDAFLSEFRDTTPYSDTSDPVTDSSHTLHTTKSMVDQYKQQIDEQQQQINQLQSTVNTTQSELESTNQLLMELQQQTNESNHASTIDHTSELSQLRTQVSMLINDGNMLEDENKQLREQLNELSELYNNACMDIQQYQAETNTVQQQQQQPATDTTQLQTSVVQNIDIDNVSATTHDNTELMDTIQHTDISSEMNTALPEVDQSNHTMISHDEFNTLTQQCTEYIQLLYDRDHRIDELSNDIIGWDNKCNELQQLLLNETDTHHALIQSTNEQFKQNESIINELHAQISGLQAHVQSIQHDIDIYSNGINERDHYITLLTKRVEHYESVEVKLHEQIKQLKLIESEHQRQQSKSNKKSNRLSGFFGTPSKESRSLDSLDNGTPVWDEKLQRYSIPGADDDDTNTNTDNILPPLPGRPAPLQLLSNNNNNNHAHNRTQSTISNTSTISLRSNVPPLTVNHNNTINQQSSRTTTPQLSPHTTPRLPQSIFQRPVSSRYLPPAGFEDMIVSESNNDTINTSYTPPLPPNGTTTPNTSQRPNIFIPTPQPPSHSQQHAQPINAISSPKHQRSSSDISSNNNMSNIIPMQPTSPPHTPVASPPPNSNSVSSISTTNILLPSVPATTHMNTDSNTDVTQLHKQISELQQQCIELQNIVDTQQTQQNNDLTNELDQLSSAINSMPEDELRHEFRTLTRKFKQVQKQLQQSQQRVRSIEQQKLSHTQHLSPFYTSSTTTRQRRDSDLSDNVIAQNDTHKLQVRVSELESNLQQITKQRDEYMNKYMNHTHNHDNAVNHRRTSINSTNNNTGDILQQYKQRIHSAITDQNKTLLAQYLNELGITISTLLDMFSSSNHTNDSPSNGSTDMSITLSCSKYFILSLAVVFISMVAAMIITTMQ